MKRNNQGNGKSFFKGRQKEERAERIARARERVKDGFYSSEDVVSFLADRMIVAAK